MSNDPMLLYAGEYESLKETKALHRKKFVSSSNQPSLLSYGIRLKPFMRGERRPSPPPATPPSAQENNRIRYQTPGKGIDEAGRRI
jgi:hypothetical protein